MGSPLLDGTSPILIMSMSLYIARPKFSRGAAKTGTNIIRRPLNVVKVRELKLSLRMRDKSDQVQR